MPRFWRPVSIVAVLALPLGACGTLSFAPLDPSAIASPANDAAVRPDSAGRAEPASPHLAKAKAYFRDRNFGLAEQAYRAAVEAKPDDAEAWLGLAAVYDELGRYDLADRAYARLLSLTGPTAQLLNNRGYSHLMRGDYKAARRDLLAARAKDPGNAYVARNIARLPR